MSTVLPFHAPSKAAPDAAKTRQAVRDSRIYQDLRRLIDLCEEVRFLAADLAVDLPGSSLGRLCSDPSATAQHLSILSGVVDTYSDLIDGSIPAL